MKAGSEFHVDIVGLGSMGMETALSRVRTGPSIWGAGLNSNACAALREAGICGASNNATTSAEELDVLLALVVDAARVKQVLFGEIGVTQYSKPGTAVMVSLTIASVDAQEIITALAGFDLEMLDAPVSGGAIETANSEIAVMVSGSDIAFEQLAPVSGAAVGKVHHIGAEPGLGSAVEIIHQLLTDAHTATGAETMVLAARVGIPLGVMYGVVINAAGNPWMFENRMHHVMDGDYTPHSAIDIFVKDLGLVVDTAEAPHFPLSLASTTLNMFTSASNAGYGKEDDSAVIRAFSGVTLPGTKS